MESQAKADVSAKKETAKKTREKKKGAPTGPAPSLPETYRAAGEGPAPVPTLGQIAQMSMEEIDTLSHWAKYALKPIYARMKKKAAAAGHHKLATQYGHASAAMFGSKRTPMRMGPKGTEGGTVQGNPSLDKLKAHLAKHGENPDEIKKSEDGMHKLMDYMTKGAYKGEDEDEETKKLDKASNDGTQPPVVLEYEMEKSLEKLRKSAAGQGGFPEAGGPKQGLPSSRGGNEGGELGGVGATSGSVTPKQVNDQPHEGQGPGKEGAKSAGKLSEDDAEPESQMTEHKKPIETIRKSYRHEREISVSKLRKMANGGEVLRGFGIGNAPAPDVEPQEELKKSEPHQEWMIGDCHYSDGEDRRIAEMMENPIHTPAVIDMNRGKVLHKSEDCPHCGLRKSMVLTSCEHCGVQTAPSPSQGVTVTPKSNQGMFRRPRAEAPLRAPNGLRITQEK
jgi:hypothetical protein